MTVPAAVVLIRDGEPVAGQLDAAARHLAARSRPLAVVTAHPPTALAAVADGQAGVVLVVRVGDDLERRLTAAVHAAGGRVVFVRRLRALPQWSWPGNSKIAEPSARGVA